MSPSRESARDGSSATAKSQSGLPSLYAWQAEALHAWEAAGRQGVVEAVTGTGKTLVGLAAVADTLQRGSKALVVVPSIELQRQWSGLFRRHLPRARVGQVGAGVKQRWVGHDVIVAVVNSLRTHELPHPGPHALLVADECHRYGSQGNAGVLNPQFDHRLGLSATYARNDDGTAEFLDPYFGGTCFQVGYVRAIADEVTAHYKVALIAVPFLPDERIAYDEANLAAFRAQRWLIEGGLVREEPFGEFMKDVAMLAESGDDRATWTAREFLRNFAERRRILAESSEKLRWLPNLKGAFEGADRSIVFTQTVAGAIAAARVLERHGLKADSVHSGLSQTDRRAILRRFEVGDLPVICAPQVLDEGIDVPAADLAVILAASRSRRQMVQRMGRVLRRKVDGRTARFAILYVSGSSEDPAKGAHGDFLEEVTDTAEVVRDFPVGCDHRQVTWYMNDFLARGPQPQPAIARDPWPAARPKADRGGPRPQVRSAQDEMVEHLLEVFRTLHGDDERRAKSAQLRTVVLRLLASGHTPKAIRVAMRSASEPRAIERLVREAAKGGTARRLSASAGADSAATQSRPAPPSRRAPAPKWTSNGPPRLCPSCGIAEHACRC